LQVVIKPLFFKYSKTFRVAVTIVSFLQQKEVKLQAPDETPPGGSNKYHLNICFSWHYNLAAATQIEGGRAQFFKL